MAKYRDEPAAGGGMTKILLIILGVCVAIGITMYFMDML